MEAAETAITNFGDDLELALAEALPSNDLLDYSSFSPLNFVNIAFPNGIPRFTSDRNADSGQSKV